jgi:hypothetical protein
MLEVCPSIRHRVFASRSIRSSAGATIRRAFDSSRIPDRRSSSDSRTLGDRFRDFVSTIDLVQPDEPTPLHRSHRDVDRGRR